MKLIILLLLPILSTAQLKIPEANIKPLYNALIQKEQCDAAIDTLLSNIQKQDSLLITTLQQLSEQKSISDGLRDEAGKLQVDLALLQERGHWWNSRWFLLSAGCVFGLWVSSEINSK